MDFARNLVTNLPKFKAESVGRWPDGTSPRFCRCVLALADRGAFHLAIAGEYPRRRRLVFDGLREWWHGVGICNPVLGQGYVQTVPPGVGPWFPVATELRVGAADAGVRLRPGDARRARPLLFPWYVGMEP